MIHLILVTDFDFYRFYIIAVRLHTVSIANSGTSKPANANMH